MKVGVITSVSDHPLLVGMAAELMPDHEVRWVDPAGGRVGAWRGGLADVYVLKDRSDAALALAGDMEERGVPVVNSAVATARCQDRVVMAELACGAGLPFAGTWPVGPLGWLVREGLGAVGLEFPVVVKSRRSRRDDVVARVDDMGQLRLLGAAWGDESVVVQPYTANSGWDYKIWVICGRVFAGLRRSELMEGQAETSVTLPLGVDDLPDGWTELVRKVGSAFSLDVYGVDVVDAGGGVPLIVDVNAFPGIRDQSGAAEELAAFVMRVGVGGVAAVSGSSL
jgi:ribosomal protein S6--L-glutamate ligase